MRVVFDRAVFAGRCVSEAGTEAVLNWCDRTSKNGLSGIALPEGFSVFCRLYREGESETSRYRQYKLLLLADIEADVFIPADQRQRDAAARAGLRVEAV